MRVNVEKPARAITSPDVSERMGSWTWLVGIGSQRDVVRPDLVFAHLARLGLFPSAPPCSLDLRSKGKRPKTPTPILERLRSGAHLRVALGGPTFFMSLETAPGPVPKLILGWMSRVGRRTENQPLVTSFAPALRDAGYAFVQTSARYGASSQR
ncbi:MAG: hypothetical protein QM817_21960 [Archangium sp.]